tara:strand:- start:728 stop:1366 length:639 start_codon:yes stop_codon:yes gene_type:complete
MLRNGSKSLEDKVETSSRFKRYWNSYHNSRYIKSEYGTTISTAAVKASMAIAIGAYGIWVSDGNNEAVRDIVIASSVKAVIESSIITAKSMTENGREFKRVFGTFLLSDAALIGLFAGITLGIEAVVNAFGEKMPQPAVPVIGAVVGAAGLPYLSSMYHSITKKHLSIIDALKQVPGDYVNYVKETATSISSKITDLSRTTYRGIRNAFSND